MNRSAEFMMRWRSLIVVVLALAVVGLPAPVTADPVEPSRSDRHVTVAVVTLLENEHLLGRNLDDAISQRTMDAFLKMLDPMKMYFLQSDIDGFRVHRNELDDMLRRGDVGFAYRAFNVFLERIDERLPMIEALLEEEHDFTADEEFVVDSDAASYARDAEEARDKWRRRIKYDILLLSAADGTEGEDAVERLERRYRSFARRMHQTDGQELLEMYLTALASSFDPHTSYMSPDTLKNFEIIMKLELEGIGATLQSIDGIVTVQEIVADGAADKDGRLQVRDQILGVGQGADGEIVDVVEWRLSDVVKLIRGEPGTTVRLKLLSVDSTEPRIIDIVREKIPLADRAARAEIIEEGQRDDGEPYRVGVINLPSFYMDMNAARAGDRDFRSTTRDVMLILDDFEAEGVDAVVLDLRRNGGGSLTEAISLTGLFIDEGPVVQVKDGDGNVQPYHHPHSGKVWKGPLVVLTSKFSASASEILAGAIQDYRRGLVVGDETTHGKGTVQSLTDLGQRIFPIYNSPQLGALKITIQQFFRPSGDSTQSRGVVADIPLPSLTSHYDIGEADLDHAIPFDRVAAEEFPRYDFVTPSIIDTLRSNSRKRQSESEGFQRILRNIDRYLAQKERTAVSLDRERFLAEREELNVEREEEKALEELRGPSRPIVERDYYLDEVFAITVDYLGLLGQHERSDDQGAVVTAGSR